MKKIQRLPRHLIAWLPPEELEQVLEADCSLSMSKEQRRQCALQWMEKSLQDIAARARPAGPARLVRGWLNEPL